MSAKDAISGVTNGKIDSLGQGKFRGFGLPLHRDLGCRCESVATLRYILCHPTKLDSVLLARLLALSFMLSYMISNVGGVGPMKRQTLQHTTEASTAVSSIRQAPWLRPS